MKRANTNCEYLKFLIYFYLNDTYMHISPNIPGIYCGTPDAHFVYRKLISGTGIKIVGRPIKDKDVDHCCILYVYKSMHVLEVLETFSWFLEDKIVDTNNQMSF